MRTDEFDYPLPPERIAQEPVEPRDAARLMVIDRASGRIEHRRFTDLPEYLRPGDLLVMNDTRVLPARLRARRPTGAQVELLLLRRLPGPGLWETLVKPGRRAVPGDRLQVAGSKLTAAVLERLPSGARVVQFEGAPEETLDAAVSAAGEVPLPPYIHRTLPDAERYQTIYARAAGSVAAPTAGLHFTPRVLAALRARGVATATITLHVGIATFRPVRAETIEGHEMHEEWYEVPPETAARVAEAQGRVIAVGTTTARCLESAARGPAARDHPSCRPAPGGGEPSARPRQLAPGAASTRLYIRPGFRFRVLDGLLTNFHMPRSTLLILISAFAGRDLIRRAYEEALANDYRFLSFGDATLIL
jgi:S-adenosylmethionine:tRNA ribosyltransferase-isomerase